jgi:hypothetical protein
MPGKQELYPRGSEPTGQAAIKKSLDDIAAALGVLAAHQKTSNELLSLQLAMHRSSTSREEGIVVDPHTIAPATNTLLCTNITGHSVVVKVAVEVVWTFATYDVAGAIGMNCEPSGFIRWSSHRPSL